jgi:hypothetical protein
VAFRDVPPPFTDRLIVDQLGESAFAKRNNKDTFYFEGRNLRLPRDYRIARAAGRIHAFLGAG